MKANKPPQLPKIITQLTCKKKMWANARTVCSYSTEVRDNTFWKVVNEVKQKCSCIKQKMMKTNEKKWKTKKIAVKSIDLCRKNGKMYEKK